MRSPQSLRRNGETSSFPPAIPLTPSAMQTPLPTFHSTLSLQKLRHLNSLLLSLHSLSFIFSLSSSVFMLTNSRSSQSVSLHWFDFDAFRFVFAAGAIVALYSLFEMVASVWEITRSTTLLPESIQVWFDFGHDQVFAYMLLSAESAGTALVKTLKRTGTCTATGLFCLQSDISVALGFVAFLFLAFSSVLSGYRGFVVELSGRLCGVISPYLMLV